MKEGWAPRSQKPYLVKLVDQEARDQEARLQLARDQEARLQEARDQLARVGSTSASSVAHSAAAPASSASDQLARDQDARLQLARSNSLQVQAFALQLARVGYISARRAEHES